MYKIPLSYTAPDNERLSQLLYGYRGVHHTRIIHDFEAAISHVTKSPYVVALNSGTAAIHLGLKLLGVQPGDEVLVSTFTYVASVNPILYLGATPVFIDSEPDTWNMDPELLELAIQNRLANGIKPKAIIVVHVYGIPSKIYQLKLIAEKYEIPILEDAAEAFGTTIDNRHAGTFGDIGILSFNNNKIITTYGGGALLTSNESIFRKAVFLSEQARENEQFYVHREVGFNYRMGPLNAAMGLCQVNEWEQLLEKRRDVYWIYRIALEPYGIKFLDELPGRKGNHWLTSFVLNIENVLTVIDLLKKDGIEARALWNPMHLQPVFKNHQYIGNGIAENLFKKGISVPSGSSLNPDDQRYVIQNLQNLLNS